MFVVVGFSLYSFSPANKMAAGSGSIPFLPLGSFPRICNEVDGAREGRGGSHACTSLPNPWRGLASVTLAPLIPSHSCCNKAVLGGCASPYSLPFLVVVAWKERIGRTQFPGVVEWRFDFWWLLTGSQFFPTLDVLRCAAMEAAARGLRGGWRLKILSMPARSGAFPSDVLELILQRMFLVLLKSPGCVSSAYSMVATVSPLLMVEGRPFSVKLLAGEFAADITKGILGAKMESLEASSTNMMISMRWYVDINSIMISSRSLQMLASSTHNI